MKFIDEAVIEVRAGHGGSGSRHFRREKFVPYGGPDGGDGGSGGSVILSADPQVQTLLDLRFHPVWRAQDGDPGGGSLKRGRSGEDLVIKVPVGTQVLMLTDGELVADLDLPGVHFLLAKGGRGGKGNAFFKSPVNRTPDHAQPGEEGEAGSFQLSLKLVADVGIIGLPNAGKSTFISRVSAARPKVADYPFTTLTPNLGVVRDRGGNSFVAADIPGLIPGAHAGKGLGTTFLKHIERTRILAHLIDLSQIEGDPVVGALHAFDTINAELQSYSAVLARKKQIVVLTKLDAVVDHGVPTAVAEALENRGYQYAEISSVTGAGIDDLVDRLARMLKELSGS